MRVCMPDGAVTGIEIQGAQTGRITNYQGRIVDVDNPAHLKALREQGVFPANLAGGKRTGGYRCSTCGFGSYFAVCGRCGEPCDRESHASTQ